MAGWLAAALCLLLCPLALAAAVSDYSSCMAQKGSPYQLNTAFRCFWFTRAMASVPDTLGGAVCGAAGHPVTPLESVLPFQEYSAWVKRIYAELTSVTRHHIFTSLVAGSTPTEFNVRVSASFDRSVNFADIWQSAGLLNADPNGVATVHTLNEPPLLTLPPLDPADTTFKAWWESHHEAHGRATICQYDHVPGQAEVDSYDACLMARGHPFQTTFKDYCYWFHNGPLGTSGDAAGVCGEGAPLTAEEAKLPFDDYRSFARKILTGPYNFASRHIFTALVHDSGDSAFHYDLGNGETRPAVVGDIWSPADLADPDPDGSPHEAGQPPLLSLKPDVEKTWYRAQAHTARSTICQHRRPDRAPSVVDFASCAAQAGHAFHLQHRAFCFWFFAQRTSVDGMFDGECGSGIPIVPDERILPYAMFTDFASRIATGPLAQGDHHIATSLVTGEDSADYFYQLGRNSTMPAPLEHVWAADDLQAPEGYSVHEPALLPLLRIGFPVGGETAWFASHYSVNLRATVCQYQAGPGDKALLASGLAECMLACGGTAFCGSAGWKAAGECVLWAERPDDAGVATTAQMDMELWTFIIT